MKDYHSASRSEVQQWIEAAAVLELPYMLTYDPTDEGHPAYWFRLDHIIPSDLKPTVKRPFAQADVKVEGPFHRYEQEPGLIFTPRCRQCGWGEHETKYHLDGHIFGRCTLDGEGWWICPPDCPRDAQGTSNLPNEPRPNTKLGAAREAYGA